MHKIESVINLKAGTLITLVCRCEVSGEGPIFPTDSKFGDMLVVVVPNLGPRIIGAKSRYTH